MKCIVFVAIVALVSAAEEKKPAQQQEEKKPVEHGLQWPLPDPMSEGDLMLHGSISFDRVQALHKGKVEDEVDKMVLAHGRQFLRRVSKFFDDNAEFKIIPILCKDLRNLNATNNRWRIEIPKNQPAQQGPQGDAKEPIQRDAPLPKDKNEKPDDAAHNNTNENETTTVQPSSSVQPSTERPSSSVQPSSERPSSSSSAQPSSEKPSDKPSTTIKPPVEPAQEKETYEVRRHDFYRQVGTNFARLLMREYRKEQLIQEETEYLQRWLADEAVHYGALAIYCNEGENVKDIKKQLVNFLEEKP
jgi:hypothetical protein